jgi:uncharacterized protein YjbI with pentapeptide repeats
MNSGFCNSCRAKININNPDHKANKRYPNCKKCDPSTDDMKYRYDNYLGWIADFLEARCICGVKIFYTNPMSRVKRCENCNPSDFHNRYSYDKKTGNYNYTAFNMWRDSERKHVWVNRDNNHQPQECLHCFEQQMIQDKITQYISQKDSIARVSNEIKVTDITIKGNLLAYTPMDQNTISIIEGYFGLYSFKDANISGLNLSGLNLKSYEFTNCNFDGCNLSGCDLSYVNFTECSMVRTRLSVVTLLTNFTKCNLNGTIFSGIFNNINLCESSLIYSRFKEAILTDSKINSCTMAKNKFTKTYMDYCSLIKLNISGARFQDTSLVNSKIIKTILDDLNLDGVNFSGSTLTLSNLHSCSLIGAKFNKCIFTGDVMMEVDANKAIFDGSIIDHTDFSGADLRQASFLDTTLSFLTVKDAQFKGAVFTNKYTLARSFFKGVASRP